MTDKAPKKTPAPKIEFAKSDRHRFKSVPLEWPLLIDGKELAEITVRRLTGKEVAAFQEAMMGGAFSDEVMMAYFIDQPRFVLDALDQDDFRTIKDTVIDFLPRKVREALQEAAEQFLTGDALPAKLPTPSSGGAPKS